HPGWRDRCVRARGRARVCSAQTMSGVSRKGSGRRGYYYRLLGRHRLQRQRSRSRSRSRPTSNKGKPGNTTMLLPKVQEVCFLTL
ncbi:hypothetical protein P4O66_016097, partial [Electrophorus voltai]